MKHILNLNTFYLNILIFFLCGSIKGKHTLCRATWLILGWGQKHERIKVYQVREVLCNIRSALFQERERIHNACEDAVFPLQILHETVLKLNKIQESFNPEFALYGSRHEYASTNIVFPPISEVSTRTISFLNTHEHTKYTCLHILYF